MILKYVWNFVIYFSSDMLGLEISFSVNGIARIKCSFPNFKFRKYFWHCLKKLEFGYLENDKLQVFLYCCMAIVQCWIVCTFFFQMYGILGTSNLFPPQDIWGIEFYPYTSWIWSPYNNLSSPLASNLKFIFNIRNYKGRPLFSIPELCPCLL